jgi:nicotinate-nucleotide adenylyltransferase
MPAPEPGQRWGILGGAFDPIHLGHVALAQDIKRLRALDGVLLVPTFEPPHRPFPPQASFEDRVEMTRLALLGQDGLNLSRIEQSTGRPSYTLNTVRALKSEYVGTEFELIVGADQLAAFSSWHRWQELLSEVLIVVGRRPGLDITAPGELPRERIVILETALVAVSSTEVRSKIRSGATCADLAEMVPAAVAEYFEAKKLYR